MAMSDATSSLAEWTHQLYGRAMGDPRLSRPPVATSPATFGSLLPDSTAAVGPPASGSTTAAGAAQPGIEGRVSKPARRRQRASRRAPTTLLNTDTANFRAMVQQFTGIPTPGPYPASSAYRPGGAPPAINYGLNNGDSPMGQANLQMQQQFQGHQQQYGQQLHYHQPNCSDVGAAFLQGFGDHGGNNMEEVGDGLFFDGMPGHHMMPSATSTNNRIDGYFS